MNFFSRNFDSLIVNLVSSAIFSLLVYLFTQRNKSISVPYWVLTFFLVYIAGSIIFYYVTKEPKPTDNYQLIDVVDKNFSYVEVELDGKNFINCKFDHCKLRIRGKLSFNLRGCSFYQPNIQFDEYAAQTLLMLKSISKDPSFKPVIDDVVKDIYSPLQQKK